MGIFTDAKEEYSEIEEKITSRLLKAIGEDLAEHALKRKKMSEAIHRGSSRPFARYVYNQRSYDGAWKDRRVRDLVREYVKSNDNDLINKIIANVQRRVNEHIDDLNAVCKTQAFLHCLKKEVGSNKQAFITHRDDFFKKGRLGRITTYDDYTLTKDRLGDAGFITIMERSKSLEEGYIQARVDLQKKESWSEEVFSIESYIHRFPDLEIDRLLGRSNRFNQGPGM